MIAPVKTLQFKGVVVSTTYPQYQIQQRESCSWAQLLVQGRPSEIALTIKVERLPGQQAYAIQAGRVTDLNGAEYILRVPVEWRDTPGGFAPQTRKTDVDNVDVIVLGDDGKLFDLQVALETRSGRFYVSVQQIFKGVIARTRSDGQLVEWFVPTDPVHAYPEASYSKIFARMAGEILAIARTRSAFTQMSRVKGATWAPKYPPKINGWHSGVVEFFNLVTGTGSVRMDDNNKFFVHFTGVLDEDGKQPLGMPLLEPLQSVYFRLGDDGRVKSVKPARLEE